MSFLPLPILPNAVELMVWWMSSLPLLFLSVPLTLMFPAAVEETV